MNPFEKGYVESRLEAEEVIKSMELDLKEYVQLNNKDIIQFANEVIKDHRKLNLL